MGYMHMRRLATIIQWSRCSYGGDTGYSIRPKNTGDMNLDVTIFTAYVCACTTSTFWPAVSIFALTRDHLPYRSDQSFFVLASVGLDLRCNGCDGLGPFRRNVRTKTGNGRDELWGGNILSIGTCYKAHHLLNKNLVSLNYDVKKTTIRNFRTSHGL